VFCIFSLLESLLPFLQWKGTKEASELEKENSQNPQERKMMYIKLENKKEEIVAYIGNPDVRALALITEDVQCDGDELDLACRILNREVNARVFTFYGDNAKEIVGNWS
jgi:hypothetical protein